MIILMWQYAINITLCEVLDFPDNVNQSLLFIVVIIIIITIIIMVIVISLLKVDSRNSCS